MNNTSIWISIVALGVSIVAFLHTVFRNASQSRIDIIEERSNLLTKIVELKLEYEQEVNHLYWLADVAHRFKLPDANEFTKMVIRYKEYVSLTQEHYDKLSEMPRPSMETLKQLKHHIDALRFRVSTETNGLQNMREQIQLLLKTHNEWPNHNITTPPPVARPR